MDRQNVVYIYPMEYYLAIKRNEVQINATTWKKTENIVLSERHKKAHIYYSIDMKCPA